MNIASMQTPALAAMAILLALSGCAAKRESQPLQPLKPGDEAIPVVTNSPRYPLKAAKEGIEGTVCFAFTIMPNGSVTELRITKSEPEDVFDATATDTLKRWRFKPKIVNGQAVANENARYCLDYRLGQ